MRGNKFETTNTCNNASLKKGPLAMYTRSFFSTTLGNAALVSIAAMVTFAMLSPELIAAAPIGSTIDTLATSDQVELA
jgi:hypothetical protein